MPRAPILPRIDWKAVFDSGLSYEDWLDQGEHPENCEKMESTRRGLKLEPPVVASLGALPGPIHVLAIAEDWCGDVVRHAPVLVRLTESAPQLDVRFITRGTWPEVFARFLTNGGEAIPQFVFLSDKTASSHWVECGHWGPMPAACRDLIARGKACGDVDEARKRVAVRYKSDPECREVIRELLGLIDIASTTKF